MDKINLPLVNAPTGLSRSEVAFAIRTANALVGVGAAWSPRKCFFRTYIAASVLRQYGFDAQMNVGLGGFGEAEEPMGHCWLTVGDLPMAETSDPRLDYPNAMGIGPNGIRYWVGKLKLEMTRNAGAQRERREAAPRRSTVR